MRTGGRTGIVAAGCLALSVLVAGCSDGQDHLKKGREANEARRFDEAIEELTLAIESRDLPQAELGNAYNDRGIAYMSEDDHDRAIADYTKAIELNPQCAPAFLNNRASVYISKGDLGKAIADCTRAIELDPKNAVAYYNRGHAYNQKGDKAKAGADLRKAKELGLDPP